MSQLTATRQREVSIRTVEIHPPNDDIIVGPVSKVLIPDTQTHMGPPWPHTIVIGPIYLHLFSWVSSGTGKSETSLNLRSTLTTHSACRSGRS